MEFAEAVLSPVAEWTAANTVDLDYQLLFFIAVEVLLNVFSV